MRLPLHAYVVVTWDRRPTWNAYDDLPRDQRPMALVERMSHHIQQTMSDRVAPVADPQPTRQASDDALHELAVETSALGDPRAWAIAIVACAAYLLLIAAVDYRDQLAEALACTTGTR